MGCAASTSVSQLEVRLAQYEQRVAKLEQLLLQQQNANQTQTVLQGHDTAEPPPSASLISKSANPSIIAPSAVSLEANVSTIDFGANYFETHPLPPLSHIPSEQEKHERRIEYDVFLSHKRNDAADFARTLKTELTDVVGLRVFLDQDAEFELNDLMNRVRSSAALVFILSPNILSSEWCQLELREALAWGVEVILLTSHGARWEVDGQLHDFPPASLIRPELQPAFAAKAIEYSRSFHKVSVDQLVQRLFGRPVQATLGRWDVPARDGSAATKFEQRIVNASDTIAAKDDTALKLHLPLSNPPLQVVHSLTKWSYRSSNDQFITGLSKPFSVEYATAATTTAAIAAGGELNTTPITVKAEYETPFLHERDRDLASETRTFMLLDGSSRSLQSGLLDFGSKGIEMTCSNSGIANESSLPLTFANAFSSKPEMFFSIVTFQSQGVTAQKIPLRQFRLHAKHVTKSGCELSISAAAPPNAQSQACTFEVNKLAVSWVAFEPRVNRTWSTGEKWLVNEGNSRHDVTETIHFESSDDSNAAGAAASSSSSRPSAPFTAPPLVMVGFTGLQSSVLGLDFEFSVSEVTTQSFRLTWHMYSHEPSNPQQVADAFTSLKLSSKTQPQTENATVRQPARIAIRWLAVPSNTGKKTA